MRPGKIGVRAQKADETERKDVIPSKWEKRGQMGSRLMESRDIIAKSVNGAGLPFPRWRPRDLSALRGEPWMPEFVKMATLDDLSPGEAREVEHDGQIYALFNVDGVISVIDGICPHQGGPLAEGELEGTIVSCPWHGWPFDVRTGQSMINPRIRQTTFHVKIEGQDVLVAVP